MLSRKHIPALDGFRALAVLLVIPHNVDLLSGGFSPLIYPAAMVMHAGWIGVQLFFVLSGFLITGALLDTRGQQGYFGAFFRRRACRILPLYFGTLAVTFLVLPLFFAQPERLAATEHNQIWLWTFLVNWTQPFGATVFGFGHFWSLAIEEQFYLLWPFIVLCCPPARLLWVCGFTVIVALVTRFVLVAEHFSHDALYQFTICRMDALALGAAAAALIRIPKAADFVRRRVRMVATAAVVLLLICAGTTRVFAMYDVSTQTLGYTILSLGFAMAVLVTTVPATGFLAGILRVLGMKPLKYIARYSYGMYVLHLPLHIFFGTAILKHFEPTITGKVAVAYALAMTVVTFGIAALSFELFESRFLRPRRPLVQADAT